MGTILYKIIVLMLFITLLSCDHHNVNDFKLPNPFKIEVTGDNYQWLSKYPGKDGELNTSDDIESVGDIHLPMNRKIEITFLSNDFLYFFHMLEINKRGMAVPGVPQKMEIQTKKKEVIQFKGNQMCGYTHAKLVKNIFVESDDQLIDWYLKQ